jgi:hypothetical protein
MSVSSLANGLSHKELPKSQTFSTLLIHVIDAKPKTLTTFGQVGRRFTILGAFLGAKGKPLMVFLLGQDGNIFSLLRKSVLILDISSTT